MPPELEGSPQGQGLRVGVVVSRFNHMVTSRLLEGAWEGLQRHGVQEQDTTIAWVPGSYEIPLTALTMAESGRYHALVCLGAVIRGETDHYEHVSREAARGIARISLETGVPTIFGVLTTDTVELAMDRAGGKQGNKGFEAAVAAIEMANLLRQIKGIEGQ